MRELGRILSHVTPHLIKPTSDPRTSKVRFCIELDMSHSEDHVSDAEMSDWEYMNRSPSPTVPLKASDGWRASEPPEENYDGASGANEDGEWLFSIVGEEVDENGRISFEVRWDDWQRPDGTKTTWNPAGSVDSDHWMKMQRKSRRELAQESMEIDIITTTDIHNTETYLRSQAYDEKLKRLRQDPRPDLMLELTKLQAKRQGHIHQAGSISQVASQGSSSSYPLRANQRASTRQKTEASLASSTSSFGRGSSKSSTIISSNNTSFQTTPAPSSLKTTLTRRQTEELLTSSSSSSRILNAFLLPPPTATPRKGKELAEPSDEGGSDTTQQSIKSNRTGKALHERPIVLLSPRKKIRRVVLSESEGEAPQTLHSPRKAAKPLSASATSPLGQRMKLQNEWTKQAARRGAAPIFISNSIDNEAIPCLDPSFSYLESNYAFAPGTFNQSDMEGFLVGCSCDSCYDATKCECQTVSALVDEMGSNVLAYTPSGNFSFNVPTGTEVVECNKFCNCALYRCVNRVSQRPRDVPVEIFKTESRGWGVRPLVDVKRGKVLGLYTGLLVRRNYDNDAPPEQTSSYVFDLDGSEDDGEEGSNDEENGHGCFSVDAKLCGNWSRFINHSCSPNLQVYLVVHDMPPSSRRPFIAFVALQDMPSKTEFTVDYDPRAGEEYALLRHAIKTKGKGKRRESAPVLTPREGTKPCWCGSDLCRGFVAC